jgi:hypothetical protein
MRLLITTILLLPFVVFAGAQNPIQPTLAPTAGFPSQTQVGTTYTVTYTLQNNLNAAERLKQIGVTTSTAGFTVVDNCSNKTVAAGGACKVTIQFLPAAAGKASIQLTLNYDYNVVPLPALTTTAVAGPTPGTGQIDGVVTAPLPSSTSSGTSYQVQFTFMNSGSASVTPTGVPLTGDMTNVTNNCTAALAPNATCTITGTLALNTAGIASVGATYEYGTGDDAMTVPLTTSTTVTSNASCAQVSGITTLALPISTYQYADNVVQFQFTNNCVAGSADLGKVSLTASLSSTDVSTNLNLGNDTCSEQTLAPGASCVVNAAIVPTSTGNNLSVTATLPYTAGERTPSPATATTSTSSSNGVVANDANHRMISVINQCPYPVWATFQAGNVVASGQATTNCKTDADCPANSSCNPSADDNKGLCYWSNPAVDANHTNGRLLPALANGTPDTLNFTILETNGQASGGRPAVSGSAIYSGGMLGRLGCTGTGSDLKCRVNNCATGADGLCQPGQSIGSPPVAFNAVEFTFLPSGTDGVYDMQMIDGVAIPMEMKGRGPSDVGTAPYYNCQATGAPIQPASPPLTALGNCSYDMAPPEGADITNYRYVTPVSPQVLCNADSDCSGGNVCGLGYVASVNKTNKVCGALEGYTSVNKGICSQTQSDFGTDKAGNDLSTTLYVNTFHCNQESNRQLYACTHPPLGSCYSQDASPETCCGCADWWTESGGNITVPQSTQSCTGGDSTGPNPDWTALVQPTVQWIKKACPTAYSYQYDDPSSSYRCTVSNGNETVTNYQVVFCPGGKTISAG